MTNSSVAVLVDGDNIPAKYAQQIIEQAQSFGSPHTWHVYGNENGIRNWSGESGFDPIVVGPNKNAADFQMSFDAVEMATRQEADAFVIVSSDGHLIHIVSHLRKRQIPVLGIGEPKTPQALKSKCGNFSTLHCPETTSKVARLVNEVFKVKKHRAKGILLSRIDGFVVKIDKKFRIKSTEFGRWSKFFEAHKEAYSMTGKGKQLRVLLRQAVSPPDVV